MKTVKNWLELFAAQVHARDLDGAEALFAADVLSFGSVAPVTRGLPALREEQWNKVWPATRGFHFLDQDLRIVLSPDGLMASIFAQWASESVHTGALRKGRATIVLRCAGDTGWQAIHTHFSLSPA